MHINMNIKKKLNFEIQIKINELRHSISVWVSRIYVLFSFICARYIQSNVLRTLMLSNALCMNIRIITVWYTFYSHSHSSMQHIFIRDITEQSTWLKKPEKKTKNCEPRDAFWNELCMWSVMEVFLYTCIDGVNCTLFQI